MRPIYRVALVSTGAILAATLLDHWGYRHLFTPGIYDRDWGRMLRIVGFYPTWIVLAIALWMQTRNRRRALLLFFAPGLGGLLAEVLKLLMRRERPAVMDGEYVFRSFTERPFSTSGLALPSSHALVAFSGAWMLCRLYPRAWPVWVGLAAGCAFTRVEAHAHFLSDVTVAAVAAWFMVEWMWRRWERRAEDGTTEDSGRAETGSLVSPSSVVPPSVIP